jgi:hypothetical protein
MMLEPGTIPVAPTLSRVTATAKIHARLIVATVVALACTETCAAEDKPVVRRDDLDVTMQIIVDPDAKLPDEVVRRITLPPRKESATTTESSSDTNKGQERAREARGQGREVSEAAREKNNEAAEQREQARRSIAEERRGNPPKDPPKRPDPPRP